MTLGDEYKTSPESPGLVQDKHSGLGSNYKMRDTKIHLPHIIQPLTYSTLGNSSRVKVRLR